MSRIVYALALLSSLTASAQTVTLSPSGYLLGANDQPLQSASTDMRFRLFDAAVNGNQLWDSGSTPCGAAGRRDGAWRSSRLCPPDPLSTVQYVPAGEADQIAFASGCASRSAARLDVRCGRARPASRSPREENSPPRRTLEKSE